MSIKDDRHELARLLHEAATFSALKGFSTPTGESLDSIILDLGRAVLREMCDPKREETKQ